MSQINSSESLSPFYYVRTGENEVRSLVAIASCIYLVLAINNNSFVCMALGILIFEGVGQNEQTEK